MGQKTNTFVATHNLGESNGKVYTLIVREEGDNKYGIALDVNNGESELVLADGKDLKDALTLYNAFVRINACGYARGLNDALDMTCQML